MTANLTARYEAALDFSSAGDHERAGEMLAECVVAEPTDFEFVEAFLKSLERKLNEPPGVNDDQPLPDALQIAMAAKQWGEVRRLAPPLLLAQPRNVATLRALAEASAASGHHQIELRYLTAAARVAPQDVELNRHRAH